MNIEPRVAWGAKPPKRAPHKIAPTPRLWLHHTAGPAGQTLAAIQAYHQWSKGWNDIAYSFLATADGRAWEGRGALIAGGHTAGDNTTSHAICAVGDYSHGAPSPAMVETIAQLVAHGHRQGWWTTRRITGGHREAPGAATACPGDRLQALIPTINARAADILDGPILDPQETFLMSLTDDQQRSLLDQMNGLTRVLIPDLAGRIERIEHALNLDGHDTDKSGQPRPSYPVRTLQGVERIERHFKAD